jgi:Cu/Ag efflux protein CusF
MKRSVACVTMAVFMVSICGVVRATDQAQRSEVVTAKATVEAVDQESHVVTLRSPEGETFDLKVGMDVRNLSQVKPGDQVTVKFYRSLLVQMGGPGQQSGTLVTAGIVRAMPGQKPGGVATGQISTTAAVVSVDKGNSLVTLKGPGGKIVAIEAIDPRNIEGLKPGDQLNITYTEAVAISVEEATH